MCYPYDPLCVVMLIRIAGVNIFDRYKYPTLMNQPSGLSRFKSSEKYLKLLGKNKSKHWNNKTNGTSDKSKTPRKSSELLEKSSELPQLSKIACHFTLILMILNSTVQWAIHPNSKQPPRPTKFKCCCMCFFLCQHSVFGQFELLRPSNYPCCIPLISTTYLYLR